jgi:DNA-directed RNA polymerase specialized sigma24 family protein
MTTASPRDVTQLLQAWSRGEEPALETLIPLICALSAIDTRKARVVELRFFGGLSVEEKAEALKVSPQTVLRDWKLVKVWLLREMRRGEPEQKEAGEP